MSTPTEFYQARGSNAAWWGEKGFLSEKAVSDYEVALREAGMDYGIQLIPMKHPITDEELPNLMGIVGDTNGSPFYGTAKSRYNPVDNREAFKCLTEVSGQYRIDSIGQFDRGRIFFINLNQGEFGVSDNGDDKHVGLIQLVTSRDQSISFTILLSYIRIVCSNTMAGALSSAEGAGNVFKVKQTLNVSEKLASFGEVLKLAEMETADFRDKLRILRDRKLSVSDVKNILDKVIGEPKKSAKTGECPRNTIEDMLLTGKIQGFTGLNAYSLLNAVTEFDTHERVIKIQKNSPIQDKGAARSFRQLQDAIKGKTEGMSAMDKILSLVA